MEQDHGKKTMSRCNVLPCIGRLLTAACKQNTAVASAAAASGGSTAKATLPPAARAVPTVVLEHTRIFFVRPSSLSVDCYCGKSLVFRPLPTLSTPPIDALFRVFRYLIRCHSKALPFFASTTWTTSFRANNIHSEAVLCQSEAKRGRLRLINFLI